MFNIIIIGAEDTENYEFFRQKAISLLSRQAKSGGGITIFTTGDEFVDRFTTRYKIDKKFFKADWKSHGKDALKYRNEAMVREANAILFFQNNKKDFQVLYDYAKNKGLTARLVIPQDLNPEQPTT